MELLQIQPSLADQVHQATLSEIAGGKMTPGARIIQEQIARDLGVSRQPVQQALALLRKQGVLQGRGLIVAPLDYCRTGSSEQCVTVGTVGAPL